MTKDEKTDTKCPTCGSRDTEPDCYKLTLDSYPGYIPFVCNSCLETYKIKRYYHIIPISDMFREQDPTPLPTKKYNHKKIKRY